MKISETIQNIFLVFCMSLMMPLLVYWGVDTVYKNPVFSDFVSEELEAKEQKTEEEKLTIQKQTDLWQTKKSKFDNTLFIVCLIVGFIMLLITYFINFDALETPLIIGSVLNICLSLFYAPNLPFLKFIIFSVLFIFLILFIAQKRKS